MSSFFRNRLEYALMHESYYLEHELVQKLSELFKSECKFKVEFDMDGFTIILTDTSPINDKKFIRKRIKEVIGVSPFLAEDNRFLYDYHRLSYRVEWDNVFQVK